MQISLKKKLTAAATALTILGGAGVAVAYWTAGGSGNGTAATGTANAITVNQTASSTALVPDGSTTLSGTFTNTTNPGPVYITNVKATISNFSLQADAGKPACTQGRLHPHHRHGGRWRGHPQRHGCRQLERHRPEDEQRGDQPGQLQEHQCPAELHGQLAALFTPAGGGERPRPQPVRPSPRPSQPRPSKEHPRRCPRTKKTAAGEGGSSVCSSGGWWPPAGWRWRWPTFSPDLPSPPRPGRRPPDRRARQGRALRGQLPGRTTPLLTTTSGRRASSRSAARWLRRSPPGCPGR